MTLDEFQMLADRAAEAMPAELLKGLTGGMVISPRAKLHPKSEVERPLFIMGEYTAGQSVGRYITLYYGSFMRVYGDAPWEFMLAQIDKVQRHELRHHIESLSGERDLEVEDEVRLSEYVEGLFAQRQGEKM